jgi:hypothetical protein
VTSGTTQFELVFTFIATVILALSIAVILPLIAYFLLWVMALLTPQRLDPKLDIYATVWSLIALWISVFNIRQTKHSLRGKDITYKSALPLVLSLIMLMTCPEWFY